MFPCWSSTPPSLVELTLASAEKLTETLAEKLTLALAEKLNQSATDFKLASYYPLTSANCQKKSAFLESW